MTNGNQGNFFSGKAGNFVSGKETAECPAWGKTHFRMIGMKRLIPLIGRRNIQIFQPYDKAGNCSKWRLARR